MALNKKRAENKTRNQNSTVKTTSLSDAAPLSDFLISRQLLRLWLYCIVKNIRSNFCASVPQVWGSLGRLLGTLGQLILYMYRPP